MNLPLYKQRLYWKEFRTLTPLLLVLFVVAIILHVIGVGTTDALKEMTVSGYVVAFGLPVLFAVGAGAFVIGQEKETRTLQWLSALPISVQDLFRVKFNACLIGLLFTWVISWGMFFVFGLLNSSWAEVPYWWEGEERVFLFSWPLHSLYLLLAGIAVSWLSRSNAVGLIILVPVSLLPGMSATLCELIYFRIADVRIRNTTSRLAILSAFQIVYSITFYWLAWQFAKWSLLAAEPQSTTISKLNAYAVAISNHRTDAKNITLKSKIHSTWKARKQLKPFSAIVWQTFRQNLLLLLGSVCILCLAFNVDLWGLFSYQDFPNSISPGYFASQLPYFILSCVLGLMVFQSDRIQRRAGFLATRGVSPSVVWAAKLTVPLSVFSVVICCSYLSVFWWYSRRMDIDELQNIVLLLSMSILFVPFAFSQWIGQISSNPIVAFVASIPLAAVGAWYLMFASYYWITPTWLIVAIVFLPLIATWSSMSRWMNACMDGRRDLWLWFNHAAFLFAFIVIPIVPWWLDSLWSETAMTDAIAMAIEEEAKRYPGFGLTKHLRSIRRDDSDFSIIGPSNKTNPKLQPNETFASVRLETIRSLTDYIKNTKSISFTEFHPRSMDFIRSEAMLCMGRAMREDIGSEELEKEKVYYQLLIQLASDLVVRGRTSHLIRDQDLCDNLEIWLLSEIRQSKKDRKIKNLWSNDLYQLVAKRLANSEGRMEARKRAVALSWTKFQAKPYFSNFDSSINSLGGYYPNFDDPNRDRMEIRDNSPYRTWGRYKVTEGIASELWVLACGGSKAATTERYMRLAKLMREPPKFYGIGPKGRFMRADDLEEFLFGTGDSFWAVVPGSQWYADWERQAEMLLTEELL